MVAIPNHFERALALLASQFREEGVGGGYTNFQKLIKALTVSLQELDDLNQDLKNNRSLDTAIGQQLDGLGEILGLPRIPGESDDSYRERLRFQLYINSAKGTPEEIIRAVKQITQSSFVWYHELYPAAYQLVIDGITFPDPPNLLIESLASIGPAGVQYPPITSTYGSPNPFTFGADSANDLLIVTDPNDPSLFVNLQVTDGVNTYLLEVNANRVPFTATTGGFAELNLDGSVNITDAGQLSEVIQLNGNSPPPNP